MKILKDYRHWIMITLVIISLVLIPFCFKNAHLRIWESIIDLKNSLIYYINELFDLNLTGEITINNFTEQPFELPLNIPRTWEEFKNNLSNYWKIFFSKENFLSYMNKVVNVFYYFSKIILIIMPLFLIFFIIFQFLGKKQNNNYNQDSKALVRWKRIELRIILPIKKWILQFISFIKDNSIYLSILALIWAYSFNFISVAFEFVAYYLYLITSLKPVTIYIQIVKLLMDASVMIDFIPGVLWFLFFLFVINKIRKHIGYSKLEHMEMMDRGFINERPIVLMLCGTMGKKKTTVITDIALSQEIMFKDKAFELILECDLMFPNFPWINLEQSIKQAMKCHYIYNLATCRRFAKSIKHHYKKYPSKNPFGYDYKRYGLDYNNKLEIIDLWKVIENYIQLYFVYVIESSLLVSNYSIRTDIVLSDAGNFPIWNTDLFKTDARLIDSFSRHSHIIDFDMLRLGKTMIKNNKYANAFEFGVINITEIGKERGNSIELQGVKKNDDSCNQKNDLFNYDLKMVRHSATIMNYPFVKLITDEQRPESWGADARDLCEIVHIDKCSETRLSIPLFFFEDLVCKFLIDGFSKRYYKYRFDRGDNCLPMYLYHSFISKLNSYYKGTYNTFGYYKLDVNVEQGTQDGEIKESKYYLMFKKIYSKRFSTDCFSDFFNEKALKSNVGINDIDTFKKEKASFEEMMKENSYFFNDLMKLKK